jgi:hypothetical protein
VRILIDVGKHIEILIPWKALNRINSIPVLAKPEAKMSKPRRKHPPRLMLRFPTTSAIEPAISRVQPLASLQVFSVTTPPRYKLLALDYLRCYRSGPEVVSLMAQQSMTGEVLRNRRNRHLP